MAAKFVGAVFFRCENSLQDSRRTADSGVGEVDPDLRDDVFFSQKFDRGKDWCGMARNNSGSGAMRNNAYDA